MKRNKLGTDNTINEENHPSLKRRHARLFITVPKKSGYGYKLKYRDIQAEAQMKKTPPLVHAHSALDPTMKGL